RAAEDLRGEIETVNSKSEEEEEREWVGDDGRDTILTSHPCDGAFMYAPALGRHSLTAHLQESP
ncbi:hypothetical protein CRG98_020369, partial [Punica granatum]